MVAPEVEAAALLLQGLLAVAGVLAAVAAAGCRLLALQAGQVRMAVARAAVTPRAAAAVAS